MGISKSNQGRAHDLLKKFFADVVYVKAHEANKTTPSCLVARSNETGRIVGTRYGAVKTKNQVTPFSIIFQRFQGHLSSRRNSTKKLNDRKKKLLEQRSILL